MRNAVLDSAFSPTLIPAPTRVNESILRLALDGEEPRCLALHRCLVRGDGLLVAQRERDLVDALDQALLAERIDLEARLGAVREAHALRRKIDGDLRARPRVQQLAQARDFGMPEHDRRHAVLEGVLEEDIAERRRDPCREAAA